MECILENTSINYEIIGEGRPILVLHGWAADHRCMLNDMDPVFLTRKGWKRIYLDLPGMGKSPGKAEFAYQDLILDILIEFIEKVIPGERFVVAGYSYGGYLARGLIHRKANLIDGLFLLAPAVHANDKDRTLPPHVVLVEDKSVISMLEPDEEELFLNVAVVQSQKHLKALREDFLPASNIADFNFLSDLSENYSFSFDVDTLDKPFPGPALIIMGRQDAICGFRDGWEILDNYPRGSFVVLDRAGHALFVEQGEVIHFLVGEWLDRIDEYVRSRE